MAVYPQNSQQFSPAKISRYTVEVLWTCPFVNDTFVLQWSLLQNVCCTPLSAWREARMSCNKEIRDTSISESISSQITMQWCDSIEQCSRAFFAKFYLQNFCPPFDSILQHFGCKNITMYNNSAFVYALIHWPVIITFAKCNYIHCLA